MLIVKVHCVFWINQLRQIMRHIATGLNPPPQYVNVWFPSSLRAALRGFLNSCEARTC